MKHMHMVRAASFSLASTYDFFYFWVLCEFLFEKNKAQNEDREFTPFSMLMDIFFIFNLAFYFPIAFMNSIVIGREMMFEFGPERDIYLGGTRDELVLGLGDMGIGLMSVLNFFNPFYWFFRFLF